MVFSTTPQEARDYLGALLDIGNKLSFFADKDKLQGVIQFAYGLAATEKQQADEARAQNCQHCYQCAFIRSNNF